jgi:hypothetical protein
LAIALTVAENVKVTTTLYNYEELRTDLSIEVGDSQKAYPSDQAEEVVELVVVLSLSMREPLDKVANDHGQEIVNSMPVIDSSGI